MSRVEINRSEIVDKLNKEHIWYTFKLKTHHPSIKKDIFKNIPIIFNTDKYIILEKHVLKANLFIHTSDT